LVSHLSTVNLSLLDGVLRKAQEKIDGIQGWEAAKIADAIKQIGKELNLQSKIVMRILRYAMAGLESGVGVPVIIEMLGKEKVKRRIEVCRSYQNGHEH